MREQIPCARSDARHAFADTDLERVPCALCGADAPAELAGTRTSGMASVVCTRCGLVYLNPRPRQDAYERFYRGTYWEEWEGVRRGKSLPDSIRAQDRDPRYDRFTEMFSAWITPGGRVLDLGCGPGLTARRLRDRSGFSVTAVEPNRAMAAAVREVFSLNVTTATLEEFCRSTADVYQCVILNHVLEHLTDPAGTLARVAKLLAPDGVLYVGVPDMCSSRKFAAPHHPYGFTPWTLSALLGRTGLSVIHFSNTPILKRGMEMIAASPERRSTALPPATFRDGSDPHAILRRARAMLFTSWLFGAIARSKRLIPAPIYALGRRIGRRAYRLLRTA